MAGNSDTGIILSPVNRAARRADSRPHWCSVARGREGFGGALFRDSTQNSQFRLCCPAKSSPNSPVVLASGVAMPSKRGQDHRTNWQREGNYTTRPLTLARKEPGTGAYIDTEGSRIENRLERACGTNGWGSDLSMKLASPSSWNPCSTRWTTAI